MRIWHGVYSFVCSLFFLAGPLAGGPGWATTVIEQSFSDLVHKAEVIAVGTVTAIEAEWNAERETAFTLITFTDLDLLKGGTGQTALTLRFLGGPTPDGTTMQIAGVPHFTLGDRTVLFVAGNHRYAVPLVGLWQGVYRVVFDPEREVDTVYTHAMQPVTTLPTSGGGILHDDAPVVREPHALQTRPEAMSLDTFTQLIKREARHD